MRDTDPTVAVRLPNWLGDTVMAVPALRAIAAALPSARVVVAGPWARMLGGQGIATTCIDYPRSWAGRIKTADTVAATRPDIAVVLPNSLEAALSAWYWGARRRIGFDTQGRGLLLTDRLTLPDPRGHQIDEYLSLVAPLHPPSVDLAPRLSVEAMNGVAGRGRALLDKVCRPEGPRVGVHLGAAFGPSKLWPTDRVAALCAALGECSVSAILLGAPSDAPVEREIQDALTEPVASLIGRDTPELMPGVLAALDVLVSADTGTAHLAAALGVATVTLFGPTDPALSSPRGACTAIAGAAPCAPCFYAHCPIDHPCMRAIPVDAVLTAVLGYLNGGERLAAPPPSPPTAPRTALGGSAEGLEPSPRARQTSVPES
jgi:heptosyltransferase-2